MRRGDSWYLLNNGTVGRATVLVDGVNIGEKTAAYFVDPLSCHEVTFVDNNGDGGYEHAVVTTRTPAKIAYRNATEIIAGGTAYRYEAHNIAPGLQAGDYVILTKNLFGGCMDIVKMEPVTGIINAYRSGVHDEYRIADTWYAAGQPLAGVALGDTARLFAVNGVIFHAEKVDTASLENVVLVTAVDPPGTLVRRAKLLLQDGTDRIVLIDQESGGSAIPVPGGLYTCTETNCGFTFRQAGSMGKNAYAPLPAVAAAGGRADTINSTAILDSAVIFVWDAAGAAGRVMTGKQLKTLALGSAVSPAGIGCYTAVVGGLNRVVLAAVAVGTDGVLPEVGNPAGRFALIVDSAWQTGENMITYRIWDGSCVQTVREENASAAPLRTRMSLIRYSAVTDGVIRDAAPAGEQKGALVGMLEGEVSFDGAAMYRLTPDTVFLYYDSSAEDAQKIGKTGGAPVLADRIAGVPVENVKYVLSGSEVSLLVVDVGNRLADATVYPVTLSNTSAAAVAVRDAYGNAVSSGALLAAGTFLNLTVTAQAPCAVAAVFSGAVYTSDAGGVYVSGEKLVLAPGEGMTMTFVVGGAASLSVQNAD